MAKRSKEKPKLYVVRKYIKAVDVKQALRLEPKTAVHDLFVNDTWSKEHLPDAIGFDDGVPVEEDEAIYE